MKGVLLSSCSTILSLIRSGIPVIVILPPAWWLWCCLIAEYWLVAPAWWLWCCLIAEYWLVAPAWWLWCCLIAEYWLVAPALVAVVLSNSRVLVGSSCLGGCGVV